MYTLKKYPVQTLHNRLIFLMYVYIQIYNTVIVKCQNS